MTKHDTSVDPRAIRAKLRHPIIDCDSHYTEFAPVFREQFIEAAGRLDSFADEFSAILSRQLDEKVVE